MSLINDALKRAKEAQKQPGGAASAPETAASGKNPEPAMRVVENKANYASPTVILLSIALGITIFGSVALLYLWSRSTETKVVKSETSVTAPTAALAVSQPAPVVAPSEGPSATAARSEIAEKVPEPVAVPVDPVPASAAPAAAASPAPNNDAVSATASVPMPNEEPQTPPAPAVPAEPQFPVLKLQGIFYNSVNPAAVINGKTYSIGGVISGARITRIEADKVTVEWNGEARVLETAQ